MKTIWTAINCRTPQAERHHHQSAVSLIKIVKLLPIIINLWILVVIIGYLTNFYEIGNILSLRFEIGNSQAMCAVLYLNSIVFKFCKWHKFLIISMSIYALLLRLEFHGILLSINLYIALLLTTSSLLYAAISIYYGQNSQEKAN